MHTTYPFCYGKLFCLLSEHQHRVITHLAREFSTNNLALLVPTVLLVIRNSTLRARKILTNKSTN